MKKARKIICIAIIAIAVVVLIMCNSINANAYEVKLSSNNSTVNSGDTFTVTMKLSEAASMMNAKITYDKDLFSYVKGSYKTNNISGGFNINETNEGKIAILYAPPGEGSTSLEYVSFQFKAKSVSEETTGKISIENDIAIVVNDSNQNLGSNNISMTECNVTIKPKQEQNDKVPVITPSGNISLKVGETQQMTADVPVTWSSANDSVATVDPTTGKITAVGEGETTITAKATSNGKTASVTVKVISNGNSDNPNPSTGAPVITPGGDVNLKVGESQQMTADQDVTWKSSDESVVTVDSTGKITAVGKGTAIIIATNANGESTSFTVTVDDSGSSNNNGNGNSNNDQNNDSNNGSSNGLNNGSNNGSNGSSSNGSSSNGSSSNGSSGGSSTGGTSTSTGNSSSTADAAVPATGESSVETIAILVIVTLIIGSIIFRRKSKIK